MSLVGWYLRWCSVKGLWNLSSDHPRFSFMLFGWHCDTLRSLKACCHESDDTYKNSQLRFLFFQRISPWIWLDIPIDIMDLASFRRSSSQYPNRTILTRMCVPIRHYSGTPAWHYNQNRVITSRPQEHSMMSDASSEPMVEEVILMKLDGQILWCFHRVAIIFCLAKTWQVVFVSFFFGSFEPLCNFTRVIWLPPLQSELFFTYRVPGSLQHRK